MSGHNITPRDRVWAAIFKQKGQFQVADVRARIKSSERPNDETIRRVLRAGTDLGVIDHQPGSPYYQVTARQTEGDARPARERGKGGSTFQYPGPESVFTLLDGLNIRDEPDFSHPDGIDAEEFINQYLDARQENVTVTESDEEIGIEDIISDERAMRLAQSGLPERDYIPVQSSRAGQPDYPEIEEHVRMKARTFNPDSPEWSEQVESLVDEIVEVVDPSDPREQSRISEWIRSVAQEEVSSDE